MLTFLDKISETNVDTKEVLQHKPAIGFLHAAWPWWRLPRLPLSKALQMLDSFESSFVNALFWTCRRQETLKRNETIVR